MTAVSQALDYLHDGLNNRQHLLGMFFDLSHAFDTVDHDLLLAKAEALGIRGNTLDWLKSYLSNRTSRVVIGGVELQARQVQMGTPKGSCISPTLFNIFVNSLPGALNGLGKPVVYADDTNVLVSEPTRQLLLTQADRVVHAVLGWCSTAGLYLNSDKTVVMEFGTKNKTLDYSLLVRVDGASIANVKDTKFLGVCLDQKFTWSSHVLSILPRLSSGCYLLKNLRRTVTPDILRMAYFALFHSVISYGSSGGVLMRLAKYL